MNLAIFEDFGWKHLLPLTWLRPACDLRCGRGRLLDSVLSAFGRQLHALLVRPALQPATAAAYPRAQARAEEPWLFVNARVLVRELLPPPAPGEAWERGGHVLMATLTPAAADAWLKEIAARDSSDPFGVPGPPPAGQRKPAPPGIELIDRPWDLLRFNAAELARPLPSAGSFEGVLYDGVHLVNPAAIQIGSAARIKPGVVLDAEAGPIEIGPGAVLQPGAVVLGPVSIGAHTIIRPGALIRENSSIGPVCRVGGEVEGSILDGWVNKQHDGFLGHSYVGQWVNLGADTVTSDLKNTYGTIRVALNGVEEETGERFLGTLFGDHAKTGIGTRLTTGGVIGAAANVFSAGRVPKFVPSFSWLGDEGLEAFRLEKCLEIARTVMGRRQVELSPALEAALRHAAHAAREIEAAGWRAASPA